MIPEFIEPWLPFFVSLGALLLAHRLTTRVMFHLLFRLTHNSSFPFYTYALLTWPGTVVHEFSHWLMAVILRVPVTLPHLVPDHNVGTLGWVRHQRTDLLRQSLIGAAPPLFGSAIVIALAYYAFSLPLPDVSLDGFSSIHPLFDALPVIFEIPYSLFYLYLLFAIANGMMPSPTDYASWPALFLILVIIGTVVSLLFGIPDIPIFIRDLVQQLTSWLTFSFLITSMLNTGLLLLIWPLERLLWMLGW